MHVRGFLGLLKKYRDGTLSREKKEAMDAWYDALKSESVQGNEREAKDRVWSNIVSETTGIKTEGFDSGIVWWKSRFFRIAVSVVLVICAGAVVWNTQMSDKDSIPSLVAEGGVWHEIRNDGLTTREMFLHDGSRVVLDPQSSIRYPGEFSTDQRKVYLEGNGFFSVTKDSLRPFSVVAENAIVSVLGTSFTVKQLGSKSATEVAVITGKVAVSPNKEKGKLKIFADEVVLTPNKKVTFYKDSDRYVTGLVENPVIIDKTEAFLAEEAFDFDEVPLSKILEKLETAYGVEIEVSDSSTLNCLITADLSSDNLFGKMELISAILNGSYQVKGNRILMSGGVCNVFFKK